MARLSENLSTRSSTYPSAPSRVFAPCQTSIATGSCGASPARQVPRRSSPISSAMMMPGGSVS